MYNSINIEFNINIDFDINKLTLYTGYVTMYLFACLSCDRAIVNIDFDMSLINSHYTLGDHVFVCLSIM